MKQIGDTIGGWMWYVAQIRAKHPDAILDYKILMQQYIKGDKQARPVEAHHVS